MVAVIVNCQGSLGLVKFKPDLKEENYYLITSHGCCRSQLPGASYSPWPCYIQARSKHDTFIFGANVSSHFKSEVMKQ